jgi:hypothetical protein
VIIIKFNSSVIAVHENTVGTQDRVIKLVVGGYQERLHIGGNIAEALERWGEKNIPSGSTDIYIKDC